MGHVPEDMRICKGYIGYFRNAFAPCAKAGSLGISTESACEDVS